MEGPAITAWATGTFAQAIAAVIGFFVQIFTHLGAYNLLWGAIAIFLACRFLLAPWIAAQFNAGASDRAKRTNKGEK